MKTNHKKYPKSAVIFKSGSKSKSYFYLITKGDVIAHNYFISDSDFFYKKGDIVGFISAITNEPYFSNIETTEDCEFIKIKVENISKIDNNNIIERISNYLSFMLEFWLSRYYNIVISNKIDLYNKEDILVMASIYKNNGFIDASYKICKSYINIFKDYENTDRINHFLKYLIPSPKPELVKENTYKFLKGTCLYSEFDTGMNIYIIKSGKIGIYNIINSKQTLRFIYTKGYVLNGGSPSLDYKPLVTTAIALENSVVEILPYEDFRKRIYTNSKLKIDYLKTTSMKILSATLKIKAVNKESIMEKMIVLIYSILKIEALFYDFNDKNSLKLLYSIDDMKNMLNLEVHNNEICSELKKIEYLELNTFKKIIITDIRNYFLKYEKYTL